MMGPSWQPKEIEGVPDGLILFDGVCILCSGWVRFLLGHDRAEHFRFTPVQSLYGRRLASMLGIDPDRQKTNVLIEGGRAYFKFDTLIQAATHVPRWRWMRAAAILPRALRNWIYDRVARNRYRLFGKTEHCMVPTPDVSCRFVMEGPAIGKAAIMQPAPIEHLLGKPFDDLPAPVRRCHALRQPLQMTGRAEITASSNPLARLLRLVAGLPKPASDIPVSVLFVPAADGSERWIRKFAEHGYASTIFAGQGRDGGHLIEHFGPCYLRFRLTPRDGVLLWTLAGWRLGPIPLPRWSVPRIACLEGAHGERFTFDIDVAFLLIGWFIRYRGWLRPLEGARRQPAG